MVEAGMRAVGPGGNSGKQGQENGRLETRNGNARREMKRKEMNGKARNEMKEINVMNNE